MKTLSDEDYEAVLQVVVAFADLMQMQFDCGLWSFEDHVPRGMIEPLRATRDGMHKLSAELSKAAFERFPPYYFCMGRTEYKP